MNPASASPRRAVTPQLDHDASIAAAKRQLIEAFYYASPARVVEKHPWLSVTATASAAMTATVIAHAPLSRRLATSGVFQAVKTLLPMAQAFALQRIKQNAVQPDTEAPAAPSNSPGDDFPF